MREFTRKNGFTLIELILVMALLATMMAIAAPSLSRFFAGRGLEEETRRFLSVTRFARSEAISAAVTIVMWIDPEEGAYGISPRDPVDAQFLDSRRYTLTRGLTLEVDSEFVDKDGRAAISFWPDGLIGSGSVEEVTIFNEAGREAKITRNEFTPEYQVEDEDDDSPGSK